MLLERKVERNPLYSKGGDVFLTVFVFFTQILTLVFFIIMLCASWRVYV